MSYNNVNKSFEYVQQDLKENDFCDVCYDYFPIKQEIVNEEDLNSLLAIFEKPSVLVSPTTDDNKPKITLKGVKEVQVLKGGLATGKQYPVPVVIKRSRTIVID